MSSGKICFDNTKFISETEHTKLSVRCNPQKGDLLISKVGTTGIPVIVDTDKPFSLFVSVALIKFFPQYINSNYLIFLLQSPLVQEQVKENTRGVGNKNWVLSAIANTLLLLPPKGGKVRRLFIPKKLREETSLWLEKQQRANDYLFLNRFGERITTRGIAQQLKNYATKYGLNPKVVYPHSFRHRFAKNFLEKFNDISLLADLMGHESIETTRIYLRRSSTEQQEIVDRVITW
jgi:Site-specific recombinase XerC